MDQAVILQLAQSHYETLKGTKWGLECQKNGKMSLKTQEVHFPGGFMRTLYEQYFSPWSI